MAALLEQLKAAGRIAFYLMLAFLAIHLWQDPSGSAQATVDFVKGVGSFFASLFDKVGEFVKGLTG